ncbi:hypothetical protein SEPCBS57363_005487 [Sporothrix epigloea]|uniref:RING-type domain-containing protein n=1 Tax=Sporothrix epigloea TaxID=1892477 RepID=A0ABP0DY65_9PEZI
MVGAGEQPRPQMSHQQPWPVPTSFPVDPQPQESQASQQFHWQLQVQMLQEQRVIREQQRWLLGRHPMNETQAELLRSQTQEQRQSRYPSNASPEPTPQSPAQDLSQASLSGFSPLSVTDDALSETSPTSPSTWAHDDSVGQPYESQQAANEPQDGQPEEQQRQEHGQHQPQQSGPHGIVIVPMSPMSPWQESQSEAQQNRGSSWSSASPDNWPTVSGQQQPTTQNTQISQQQPWTEGMSTSQFGMGHGLRQLTSHLRAGMTSPSELSQEDEVLVDAHLAHLTRGQPTNTPSSLVNANMLSSSMATPATAGSPANSSTAATASFSPMASASLSPPSLSDSPNVTNSSIITAASNTTNEIQTSNRSERRRPGRHPHHRRSGNNLPVSYDILSSEDEPEGPGSRRRETRSSQQADGSERIRVPIQDQPLADGFANNDVRATGHRIVTNRFIVAMEVVQIDSLDEDDKMCVICYNDFGTSTPEGYTEYPLRLPKCKHIFGDRCIKTWLKDSDNCPYCRDKLAPEPQVVQMSQVLGSPYSARSFYAQRQRLLQAQVMALHRQNSTAPSVQLSLRPTNNASTAPNASSGTSSTNTAGRPATLGERRIAAWAGAEDESRRRVRRRHLELLNTATGTFPDALSNHLPVEVARTPNRVAPVQSARNLFGPANPMFAFHQANAGNPVPYMPPIQGAAPAAANSIFGGPGRLQPTLYGGARIPPPNYPQGTHNNAVFGYPHPNLLAPPTAAAGVPALPVNAERVVFTSPFNQQIPPMAGHSFNGRVMHAQPTVPMAPARGTPSGPANGFTPVPPTRTGQLPQNNPTANRNSMP